MAAQQGRKLLLKQSDGGSPDTYTTIGGFRAHTITINESPVDITNKSSLGRFRESVRAALKTVSISGNGVFEEDTGYNTILQDIFESDDFRNYQLVVPGLAEFEGPFNIDSLEFGGNHDGEVTFSITMSNAGHVEMRLV